MDSQMLADHNLRTVFLRIKLKFYKVTIFKTVFRDYKEILHYHTREIKNIQIKCDIHYNCHLEQSQIIKKLSIFLVIIEKLHDKVKINKQK